MSQSPVNRRIVLASRPQGMSQWVQEGKVKAREDVVSGLEHAPSAFLGLLEGRNFGKLVVKVSD